MAANAQNNTAVLTTDLREIGTYESGQLLHIARRRAPLSRACGARSTSLGSAEAR